MARHLLVRILSSECPLDASVLPIAAPLPSIDFCGECGAVRQTPIKALAIKDADFDFSHVEPTGVPGRVVEYDAAQKCLRLLDAENFLEALAEVGIEVVQNQMDAARGGIDLFEQMPDEDDEIDLGTMVGNHDGSPSSLGFHCHEQIAGAGANVLVIQPHGRSGLDRQGRTRVFEQLLALLVQTDDRLPRSEWTGVEIEQVVHSLPIFLRQPADAPHQFAPRLDTVFFSSRRMVSRLIGPIPTCATCSSNSSVQRLAPAGGSEQAKAEICASTSVSYRSGLPVRAMS